MKRTTLALATLITGAGLALGAAAQSGTDKPTAPKAAAAHECKHDGHESAKADCPKHEGKHHGGKHHGGKDGKGGMGHHGKGHHGKGEGCMHDGAKGDAAGKPGCMHNDMPKDAKKDEKK